MPPRCGVTGRPESGVLARPLLWASPHVAPEVDSALQSGRMWVARECRGACDIRCGWGWSVRERASCTGGRAQGDVSVKPMRGLSLRPSWAPLWVSELPRYFCRSASYLDPKASNLQAIFKCQRSNGKCISAYDEWFWPHLYLKFSDNKIFQNTKAHKRNNKRRHWRYKG